MPPVIAPILVPATIMGVALLASWGAWRRRPAFEHGHWGGAVGIAGGFFAAHVLLKSWPGIPPERADDWMAWSAVPLAALGVAQRWWGTKWYVSIPVRVVVSAGLMALLLRSHIESRWDVAEAVYLIGGLALATAALWQTLETIAAYRDGASLPLSLWLVCAVSAGTFALAGSASFGQLAGALAGVFGAAVVMTWWCPGISLSGGALAVFAPLFAGLVARGYFHAELPVYSAVLLYLAPFALWWGEQRSIRFKRPWKAALWRMGFVSPALAAAALLAYLLVFRESPGDGYSY